MYGRGSWRWSVGPERPHLCRWPKWDVRTRCVGLLSYDLFSKLCPCGCGCIVWRDGCGWAGLWSHLSEMRSAVCVAGVALGGPDHSAPLFWPFPTCVPGSSYSHCSIPQGSSASLVVPGHVCAVSSFPSWLESSRSGHSDLYFLLSKSTNRMSRGWVSECVRCWARSLTSTLLKTSVW